MWKPAATGSALFVAGAPLVFDDDQRPFHGVQPYDGFEVQMEAWAYTRL